ncbi:MAG: signal peptide peptidase SppA [Elusimicrobiales bacterium]|nr:signal peptide peptidase SppA [Elusimicrobiales bacterium]
MEEPNMNMNQPDDSALKSLKRWMQGAAIVFLCAVLSALFLSAKNESVKKDGGNSESLSGFTKSVAKKSKDGIGVVRIYGPISHSMKSYDWEKAGSSAIASRIRKMGKKKNVKAIVLDINTPGGTVAAVQEIYDAVMYVRKEEKKKVIATFGDVSASGGYYVAVACDEIFAYPGTLTGSIGVIMDGMNYGELMKKIGLKSEVVKSGKFKDIGSPSREMSEEERQLLQEMINDTYDQFLTAVAEGRKMDKEKARKLADGRIFTGRQAKANGLVDTLGNYQDAIDRAGVLAGLGKNPTITSGGSGSFDSFFSMMDSRFGGSRILSEALEGSPKLEYRLYMK